LKSYQRYELTDIAKRDIGTLPKLQKRDCSNIVGDVDKRC